MEKIAIIKYNAGNIYSVVSALKRLGVDPLITMDKTEIMSADKVIFPGVGEAANTMKYLQKTGLDMLIPQLRKPTLGICLGMQLMCKYSEEGNVDCLGIFDTEVKKFIPNEVDRKVPHMGWNTIKHSDSPLFEGLKESEYVYFVHSYFALPCADTAATTEYIQPFSAALSKDNFYATQFHPEKSGEVGEVILKNFLFNL